MTPLASHHSFLCYANAERPLRTAIHGTTRRCTVSVICDLPFVICHLSFAVYYLIPASGESYIVNRDLVS